MSEERTAWGWGLASVDAAGVEQSTMMRSMTGPPSKLSVRKSAWSKVYITVWGYHAPAVKPDAGRTLYLNIILIKGMDKCRHRQIFRSVKSRPEYKGGPPP